MGAVNCQTLLARLCKCLLTYSFQFTSVATSALVRYVLPFAFLSLSFAGMVESLCSSRSANFAGTVSGYCAKICSKSSLDMWSNAYWLMMGFVEREQCIDITCSRQRMVKERCTRRVRVLVSQG